jgi:hypothetical protein
MALVAWYKHRKFREDWYRRFSNVKDLSQKFERLQCWYYWWVEFTMYVTEIVSVAWYKHTKFHEDWYRCSSNIKDLSQKSERLQCWYYQWEEFMMWIIELASCGMIHIPGFTKIGSAIQKLIGRDTLTHRWQGDLISIHLFLSKIRKLS